MCRLVVPSDDGGVMAAVETKITVDASNAIVNNIREALESSPELADALQDLLLEDAEWIKGTAEEMAQGEIHVRPPNRRTAETAGKRHYNNSFDIAVNRATRLEDMRVSVGNSSPIAGIIENGSAPHQISGNPWLRFPYIAESSPSGPDMLGHFAMNWGEGKIARRRSVSHPGTAPHRILERALDEYMESTAPVREL
jgi:hypothetical protein